MTASQGGQLGRAYRGDLDAALTRLEQSGGTSPRDRGELMALGLHSMTPDQRQRLNRLQGRAVAAPQAWHAPDTNAALTELEAVQQPTDFARGALAALAMRPLLPSQAQRVADLRRRFGQGVLG